MAIKLTVIFYILICFEIGALLIFLPWSSYWNENFFLFYIASHLHSENFLQIMHSGYTRGAITGLGIINIVIGIIEIFNFKSIMTTIANTINKKKARI